MSSGEHALELFMKYFVLKPGGDNEYAHSSREAMRMYAYSIRPHNEDLSNELIAWADGEEEKANRRWG